MESPIFVHDVCDNCVYLGPYGEGENPPTHDLWFCMQAGVRPTVMARWGSDGWEYHAGLGHTLMPEMIEAERRARARGFL